MNGCAFDKNPELCAACGNVHMVFSLHVTTPYPDSDEEYDIYACKNCGHAVSIGRCDAEYLAGIYAQSFHSSDQQAVDRERAPIRLNAQDRARKLAQKKRQTGKADLLDVGAGTGAFLTAAQNYFTVQGVEFSVQAADHARGLGHTIHTGDFLEIDFGKNRYDIITFWDVLASLHDPQAALEKCYDLLHEDGRVVLTLPMIDSYIAKLLGKRWPLMIPPVNLHYFTRGSIAHLANKTGFKVEEVLYEGKKVSLQFLAIKAARSFGFSKLEPFLSRAIPRWNININTRDIASVTLIKSSALAQGNAI